MTTPFLFSDEDKTPLGSFAAFETDEDAALWPLKLRRRAHVMGFEIAPWRVFTATGVNYIMGWTDFNAPGETVVEWLQAHLETVERDGVGDLELWESAWRFYIVLSMGHRVRFKVGR